MRGYSVELHAHRCGRPAGAEAAAIDVQWIAVDSNSRIDAVATGRADAECGTTTITLSRMERVDFSVPIFVDGAALAVRAKSPVQRVGDLKDRRVAVIVGTTTERALRAALDVAVATATIVPVGKPEEGAAAVTVAPRSPRPARHHAVASRSDETRWRSCRTTSFEPYGNRRTARPRAVSIYKRGDIDAIFQRWLAPLGKPSALLNAMFYLNSLPE